MEFEKFSWTTVIVTVVHVSQNSVMWHSESAIMESLLKLQTQV